MSNVSVSGYLQVAAEDLEAVLAALPAHILATRSEPGRLRFEVTHSADEPGRFEVYEEFTDSNAYQAHQRRMAASVWAEVSKPAARHYGGLDEKLGRKKSDPG